MQRARDGRWMTPLGRFVSEFTVRRLCAEFSARGEPVTPTAVEQWLAGRTMPRPRHAQILVMASGGTLTLDDIWAHSRDR